MIVKLILEQAGRRQTLLLRRPESVLGRGRGVNVRLPSAEVSRRHCRILARDGFVVAEDLGSSNGTFLNGRPLEKAEPVRPGDTLRVGPAVFVVDYDLTPAGRRRLEEFGNAVEVVPVEEAGDAGSVESLEVVESDPDLEAFANMVELVEGKEAEVVRRTPEQAPTARKAPVLGEEERLVLPEAGELRGLLEELDRSGEKGPGR